MASRGVYRGIYSVLPDDPDFQHLTPFAKLVLYTARVCRDSGPSAIFRYYAGTLMAQTGLSAKQLESALVELEMGRWIERDGSVLWVRNGLRYDPHISLANQNHRQSIAAHLESLPRSPVVLNFCEYYTFEIPSAWPSIPIPDQGVGSRDKGIGNREPEKGTGVLLPAALASGNLNGVGTWTAYSEAYEHRYGVLPVRNRTINSQLKHVVERLGMTDAPHVAEFYVGHNGRFYVQAGHSVGLLLRDAEKLRTEWATGRSITDTGARHADEHEQRRSVVMDLLAKAERQQRERRPDAQS